MASSSKKKTTFAKLNREQKSASARAQGSAPGPRKLEASMPRGLPRGPEPPPARRR